MKLKQDRHSRGIMAGCALILSLFFLSSCTWLIAPPKEEIAARQIVDSLADRNNGLMQFKGLLNLGLKTTEKKVFGRAAWVAAVPNRLRVEWLSMMGQPLLSCKFHLLVLQ